MAIDTVHHRLFSGCNSGGTAVSDYQAGKVVATVPIGQGLTAPVMTRPQATLSRPTPAAA